MDFAEELTRETAAFGDVVFAADQQTPVATCPDWTMGHLFRHVGRGNRWSAQIVADRMDTALSPRDVRDGKPPEDDEGARKWLLDGATMLVDAVQSTGPDTPVWTFTGPQPATWWIRRRAHEVLVHRADAVLAVGAEFDVAPEMAADTISELFGLMVDRMPDFGGKSVHLHATDDGLGTAGEWTITNGAWSHEHGKGDAALRGTVKDLMLVTTRRTAIADTGVEQFGDDDLVQTWLAGMKI